MKKYFAILAAALFAFAACQKPDPEPTPVEDSVTLMSDAVVNIGSESSISVIKFKATNNWLAYIYDVNGSDTDYAVLDKVTGDAGENSIKLTAQGLPEGVDGRDFNVVISCGTASVEVMFFQGKVFYIHHTSDNLVSQQGGKVTFDIITNCKYEVKTYDKAGDAFEWAPVTRDGDHFTVDVQANKTFDERDGYVKFTIDEIQVPVIDEETGEPTGETEAMVARVRFFQAGNTAVAWSNDFIWDYYADPSSFTMAICGDNILISNSNGVIPFNKKTGEAGAPLTLPKNPQGITNDDAGNLVFFFGGNYPLEEGVEYIPLEVYVLPKGETDFTKAKKIITYTNGWYGYGLDNIRVSGDATGNAVVDFISAAGWDGGSSIVSWVVTNGECELDPESGENIYSDYVSLSWTSAIWSSRNAVARHMGTTLDSGLYSIGYDGNYNLHYNNSMSAANWQEVLVSGSSWAEGYNAIDAIEWAGHKFVSFIGMSYFGKTNWGDDTAPWSYMPSYLWLVNVDDPANPVKASVYEYYMTEDLFVYGSTTDVCLEVEGDKLVAYVVDSGVSKIMKFVYNNIF